LPALPGGGDAGGADGWVVVWGECAVFAADSGLWGAVAAVDFDGWGSVGAQGFVWADWGGAAAGDVPTVYELLKGFAPARWSLFFLISVGRGKHLAPLTPEEGEKLMAWVYETGKSAPFFVATTEAPSFRRVALQRMKGEGMTEKPMTAEAIQRSGAARGFGIRDGHGVVFVGHNGGICPAGFLPVVAGNVKSDSLVEVYRHSPLFESLHRPEEFEGRCGACEYHSLCGGSRARAYEASGDALGEDPFCQYEPHAAAGR
jgi:AdoMet-dependent heme synthase